VRHTIVPTGSSALLVILAALYAVIRSAGIHALLVTFGAAGLIALGFCLLYALSRGRAMGLGDTPVAFGLALITGSSLALPGLVFSFWIGAVIGIFILVLRRGGPTMGIEVPFVPFMAAGFLLALFTQWNPFIF
jgi:prepilin signal peptidase PulO-like enzyme (type II secretory pathway)